MIHPCLRVGVGLVVGLSLASCGVISSDVTNFDLTLPDKKFSIDAGKWQVDSAKAAVFLNTSCASSPNVCNMVVQQACATGCTGTCSAAKTCELSLDVSLYQPVNLVMEKPELKSINDEPVIKVAIDSVTYEVTANTLNVDTPELTVYVAPSSVMTPTDPMAKVIGTIAPIPAGQVTSSPQPIMFTATGKAELINVMSTFKTPFNVIVGSSIVVNSAQDVPMGKLDAVVHIKGHAGL
ncbi:MAG TPA: hypothetical protein VHN14_27275 [Kofleriaceae bacterium]|jgi:hypothetical protein|nr:hypothetical protein [Kofleriaceae bacterium]